MSMQFKRAKRALSYLRLAIQGPSGSGKTYGALQLAKGLGGRIAVIDTERGSASLYADMPNMPEFDVLELDEPYSPERYIAAINAARDAGYDVLVIDSMTHEWSGTGGCLELNERIARARFNGNTWGAWSETTPRHRAFVDAMLQAPMHIIATMRSKTEVVQNEKGRFVKQGTKSEQRDGMDYEFTVVFDAQHDHSVMASKDRTGMFTDPLPRITDETGAKIAAWLASAGVTPEEFENLMSRVLEAPDIETLTSIGHEIAAKGLSSDDRQKMKAAWMERKAELTSGTDGTAETVDQSEEAEAS